jgi:cytidylate kinase
LGYECIDQEVFRDAAAVSGIDESKLSRAFREPPSFFGMSETARRRSIAHVAAALARHMLKDNVIYHGSFGHLLIPGVSHVLKVRIYAQREDRVAARTRCDGEADSGGAEKALRREDRERQALAKMVFEVDDEDTDLFDLVINTSQVDVDTAVAIIASTAKLKRYQPMTYSMRCMENLELSLRAKASVVDLDPAVVVEADGGNVRIRTRCGRGRRLAEVRRRAAELEGAKSVEIDTVKDSFGRIAAGGR